jgi:pyruvate ferredoxin oxidoreductase gamma subunit
MVKDLIEIRWHGRGGQGAKTSSQILAETAMKAGYDIQAFPEYGPERGGAPMKAYTRVSRKRIVIHSGVQNPDIVAVVDPSLLEIIDVTQGLPEDGILLVNTTEKPEEIRNKLEFITGTVGTVDATTIALETLGRPMPNLPMLGALLKAEPLVSIDDLEGSIRHKFEKKIGEEQTRANIEGVRRAYEEVVLG